jgi:hypothetical protein
MTKRLGKISPVRKEYPADSFKTLETSLSAHGYVTFPGTFKYILPKMEPSGKYRTGLDVNAGYLQHLSDEEREAEIQRIEEDLKFIAANTNGLDVSPTSQYYKYGSHATTKVQIVNMGNEDRVFDLSDPFQLITWRWLSVHPDIAPSYEATKRAEYQNARYYIADDTLEQRTAYNKKKAINSAKFELEKMTPTKRKQIARLMGLPVSDDTTEEVVYNEIDTALEKGVLEAKGMESMSALNLFNELVRIKDDRLKIKSMVKEALQHNIYRFYLGNNIYEGENKVANSEKELVDMLLNEKHQDVFLALERKLKEKKIFAA